MPLFGSKIGATSYTATHYVDVYTNVGGTAPLGDYEPYSTASRGVQFANATTIGNPCTLGEAMANATAGDVIECAAGVYSSDSSISDKTTAFYPANSGSAGNQIIFYAVNPAANNYGSTSLYSELRRASAAPGAVIGSGDPQGATSRDYIIIDGFYMDETQAAPDGNTGIAYIGNGSANSELRRLAFDRDATANYASGDNKGCVSLYATSNAKVLDCYFNGKSLSADKNQASILVYSSSNHEIRNNYFNDAYTAIFLKSNLGGGANLSGDTSYNEFNDCELALNIFNGDTINFHHNLVKNVKTVNSAQGGLFFDDRAPSDYSNPMQWRGYNNTFHLPASASGCVGFLIGDALNLNGAWFRDNIVYADTGFTGHMVDMFGPPISNWAWTDFADIDHNCYYINGGATSEFTARAGTGVSGLTNWQTETSQESASITSNPEFVSVGTNYRLANNSQAALTASSTGGRIGCYVTGNEDIGVRSNPVY